jgi:hypothetical protein
MMKFRKKLVEIEAIQWTGVNLKDIQDFGPSINPMAFTASSTMVQLIESGKYYPLIVPTLEDGPNIQAIHIADVGDWIIRGAKNELYPCKPDIFEQTYEKVE